MIPPRFDYLGCRSVEEALTALGAHEDGKVLAGGHSLVPVLKMRLNEPSLLVDIGRVPGLAEVDDRDDEIHLGAMTTYQDIIDSPLVRAHCPLLAQAAGTIADPQVRHRGTLGGALAHADPAGDLGAVAVALGCAMVIAGKDGERTVPADEFFVDYFETAVGQEELLVRVIVPKQGPGSGGRYEKFNRAAHMWSIVGVCAVVRVEVGRITEAGVALTNMAPTPVRARATEAALVGCAVEDIAMACDLADLDTSPTSDANAQADYRRHLARVLTRRAVTAAMQLAHPSRSQENQ